MTDDLISRQALIAEIMRRGIYPPGVRHAIENAPAIDAVPTIDAVPVVRGKWENPSFIDPEDNLDPRMKCSECGEVDTPLARWNYCPNCGAKMDKED